MKKQSVMLYLSLGASALLLAGCVSQTPPARYNKHRVCTNIRHEIYNQESYKHNIPGSRNIKPPHTLMHSDRQIADLKAEYLDNDCESFFDKAHAYREGNSNQ